MGWEGKLKRETDKLESFKSDTQKNIQQMAEERNELLSRIASSDEILKSVEDLHKLERERTTDNMEAQMKVERKESERLVGKLEKVIEQLKNDKAELAEQLENITKKCEDTEDALYDAQ